MIKTIHIKLLLLFSLSILLGHSVFAQDIGDDVPVEQHVCVDANVTYTVFGFPGSTIQWYVDGVDLSSPLVLNNPANNVPSSSPLYQKGSFIHTWDATQYPAKTAAYLLQIKEFSGSCESSQMSLNVYVHRKPTVSASVTSISCNSLSNGKITISNTTSPYSPPSNFNVTEEYSIDGSNYAAVSEFNGLGVGNYTLHYRYAYDDNGTKRIVKGSDGEITGIVVSQPNALALSATITDATCTGGNDGAIDFSVSGGESTSLHFDGTNGVVQFGNYITHAKFSFTLEGWVHLDASHNYNSGVFSLFGERGPIELTIQSGDLLGHTGLNHIIRYPITELNDDRWHHVAFTGDGSNIHIYVDGILKISASGGTGTDGYGLCPAGSYFQIGAGVRSGGTSEPFKGDIAQVRFWEIDRIQAEILAGMTQVMTGSEIGLVADYRLNEGSGNTVTGVGSNAFNGSVSGDVTWLTSEPIYKYSWTKQGDPSFTSATQDLIDVATGTYDVTVTTLIGCSANGSYTVGTDVDTEDPIIVNCPSDRLTGVDAGQCDAVVTWTEPNATDNCTAIGDLVWTKSHVPGSTFPVGTTAVTYTAKDAADNISLTCGFNVIVSDDEGPVLADLSDLDIEDCVDDETLIPQRKSFTGLVLPTARYTDNCSSTFVVEYRIQLPDTSFANAYGTAALNASSAADPSGFEFPEGTSTLYFRVLDDIGNISNIKTYTVKVNHKPNPGQIEF